MDTPETIQSHPLSSIDAYRELTMTAAAEQALASCVDLSENVSDLSWPSKQDSRQNRHDTVTESCESIDESVLPSNTDSSTAHHSHSTLSVSSITQSNVHGTGLEVSQPHSIPATTQIQSYGVTYVIAGASEGTSTQRQTHPHTVTNTHPPTQTLNMSDEIQRPVSASVQAPQTQQTTNVPIPSSYVEMDSVQTERHADYVSSFASQPEVIEIDEDDSLRCLETID